MESNLKYVGMAGNIVDYNETSVSLNGNLFNDELIDESLGWPWSKKNKTQKPKKVRDGSQFKKWVGQDGYINTVGGTAANLALAFANVKNAIEGNKPIIVENNQGQRKDITAEVKAAHAQSGDAGIQQLMAAMLAKNDNAEPKGKDNTALYIGLGVGCLILVVGTIAMTKKK